MTSHLSSRRFAAAASLQRWLSWSFVLVCLPAWSACGPAVIGVGLAGATGGGGTTEVPRPEATPESAPFQPEDGQWLVSLRVKHATANRARLRLEYDLGNGRVRVPASSVVDYDKDNRRARPALPVDADGNLLVSTSASGSVLHLLWNHSLDLGKVEARNVTLFAVCADETRTPAVFDATQSTITTLLTNATIGRQLGALSDVVVRRAAGGESDILVDCVVRDQGGDTNNTQFDLEYALTAGTPGNGDFVPLPALTPTTSPDSVEADGRVRTARTFKLNPISLSLPWGAHPNIWVRIRNREVYPLQRSDVPGPTSKSGTPLVVAINGGDSKEIGVAPVIQSASVVDPSSSVTNAGDPLKPWLRLPVSVQVFNPSDNDVTMVLELTGTYRPDGGTTSFPITPFFDGGADSATQFVLPARTRQTQYLVWNVVRDEGLGNLLINDPPFNPLRTAEVSVAVRLVGVTRLGNPLPVASSTGALQSTASAGFTTLSTPPFVDFRENLLLDARRLWSAGNQITQETRDVFYTQAGGVSGQELVLGADQQFEALQIVPPPPELDFSQPPFSFTNGVFDLAPTDFAQDVPDALVWINSFLFHVIWPATGAGATATEIPNAGADLTARGRNPVSFTLGVAPNEHKVTVFYSWAEQIISGNKRVTVRVKAVVQSPQGSFSVLTGPDEVFEVAGTPDVGPIPVLGEFDGNAATREVVIGTFGSERATPGRPGLLHMWTFQLNAGVVTFGVGVQIPAPLPTFGDATRNVSRWELARWRDDSASRDALVLVRQLDGTASLNRQVDVLLLRQGASGGFVASWTLLTADLSNGTFPGFGLWNLRTIFAEDIDGGSEGVDGSDLLLVFERRLQPSLEQQLDVWLFARRANGAPQWKRVLKNLAVQDPQTGQPGFGRMFGFDCQLVDVNGDRQLDLVTGEALGIIDHPEHWNYMASTLAGVAGRLGGLENTAGAPNFRSALPALLDVNRDGFTDIITGGRLHLAQSNGTYSSTISGFAGAANSSLRAERLWLDAPADTMDLVVCDPVVASQNRVDRIGGLAGATQTATQMLSYSFGGTAVRECRALMAPDSPTRRIKDLVALVGATDVGTVQRGRIDVQNNFTSSQFWPGQVAVPPGMALVRRGQITGNADPAMNTLVQDVAFVNAANSNQIVVLESHTGYQPRMLNLPAGEQAVRVSAASVTSDDLEDLCVLTRNNDVYRVRCYVQSTNANLGVGQPAAVVELLRFQQPFTANSSSPRAFQFDRSRQNLANGFLLFDDLTAGSTRSEVRFVRPVASAGGLAATLVRSPLNEAVNVDVDCVVRDSDHDGVLEVIGGEQATTQGLKRVRANLRP